LRSVHRCRYSRAFDIFVDGRSQRVMAPYVDLLNHGFDPTWYEFSQSTRRFNLYTKVGYDEGEEVTCNYDPKTNIEYLMQYGFVLDDNPYDAVGFQATVGDDIPNHAEKMALVQERKTSLGLQIRYTGMNDNAWYTVRTLVLSDKEIRDPEALARLRAGRVVSDANEHDVMITMVNACKGLLSK